MREVVRYKIPMAGRTKKNHMQIVFCGDKCPLCKRGKSARIIQGSGYSKFEKDCGWFLNPRPKEPINFPVNVCCIFYMDAKRRVDGLNLLAAIDDILVKFKILEDDSREFIAGHDGSRVYLDSKNPRVEIVITTVDDYEQWKEKDE